MEDRSVKRLRLQRLLVACWALAACGNPVNASQPAATGAPPLPAAAAAFHPVREPSPASASAARTATALPGLQSSRPRSELSTITASRLSQQAAVLVTRGEQELQRGTLLSAQQSGLEALRAIAESNDYQTGGSESTARFRKAVAALREAEDFTGRFGAVGPAQIARMVQAHETPVLKAEPVDQLCGTQAADIYLDFARQQFAEVAAGNPTAVRALIMLSGIQQRQSVRTPLTDATAITLLRAAVQADPSDPLIANELGYRLLQQGLRDEAGWVLRHSLALRPTEAAVRNLAEVLRQQGQIDEARQWIARLGQLPPAKPLEPSLLQLTPQQFAQVSPPTLGPTPRLAPSPVPTAATGHPASRMPATDPAAMRRDSSAAESPAGPVERMTQAVSQFWK